MESQFLLPVAPERSIQVQGLLGPGLGLELELGLGQEVKREQVIRANITKDKALQRLSTFLPGLNDNDLSIIFFSSFLP